MCDRHLKRAAEALGSARLGREETTVRRPVAIDVFAGVGGLSLGFEQAGFDVLAAVEYDPVHAAVHRFNFPLTAVECRDVRRIGAADLRHYARRGWRRHYPGRPSWDGVVDVLIGGPSCQGFSTGGLGELDDQRNELLGEFVRLVVELRPLAFCLENVPGLLQDRHWEVRESALRRLRRAGYKISGERSPLNAADFGVPQNRRRLLIMGSLLAPVSLPEAITALPPTVSDAFEGLPDPQEYEELRSADSACMSTNAIAERAAAKSPYARILSGLESDPMDWSHMRIWKRNVLTNSRVTQHTPEAISRFGATAAGHEEKISRYYRLPLDGQARTLRAGTGRERGAFTSPRPIHPAEPRTITVREAARLHSFPDWFRFHVTNWHGHRQVGNSVPPLLARSAAESIKQALKLETAQRRMILNPGDEGLLKLSVTTASVVMAAREGETPSPRARERRSDRSTPARRRSVGRAR